MVSGYAKTPYHPNRKEENDDISYNVGDSIPDEKSLGIYTSRLDRSVPEAIDGMAGEDGNQDNSDPPSDNDYHDDRGQDLEFRHCEDSSIEGENTQLDGKNCRRIDKLVCKKTLLSGPEHLCLSGFASERTYLEIEWDVPQRHSSHMLP